MIGKLVLFVGLAVLSFYDVKKQQLPLWILGTLGSIGVCLLILQQFGVCRMLVSVTPIALVASILPGLMLLMFSLGNRGMVGSGDGLTVCLTGLFLGYADNLLLVVLAFVGCGLVSLWLICVCKKKRNTSIPFVPFLLIADLALLW